MKRRSNSDYFGPSRGFAGFMHRVMMILLYPFRKPFVLIPLLIILYLAPTFIGAKPTEVHLWYWNKIQTAYNSSSDFVKEKSKDLFPDGISATPEMGGQVVTERGTDQLVDMRQKFVRRQMFEKAKSAPQVVDILESEQVVPVAAAINADDENSVLQNYNNKMSELNEQNTTTTKESTIQVSQKLPLVYLKAPVTVIGKTIVQNANEIIVDGTYIFLYGVYVDPNLPKGIEAKKFLEQFVKDKVVRCDIVAHTYQDIATALCYVDNENINQTLVDENFSRNVAL